MAVLKTREYMYAYGYMHSFFLLELRSKSMYEIFVKDSKTKMIRTAPIIYQVSYKSSYQSLNASNVKLFLQCICQLFWKLWKTPVENKHEFLQQSSHMYCASPLKNFCSWKCCQISLVIWFSAVSSYVMKTYL